MRAALFLSWLVTCVVVIWAGAFAFSVASQPENPPNSQQHRDYSEEYSSPETRGMKGSPLFVRISEPSTPQESANYPKHETGGNASEKSTAIIAALALIVAIWQLIYFAQQLRIMNQTLEDTKQAADVSKRAANAAEDSIRAMQASDERQLRPYVGLRMEGRTDFSAPHFAFEFICTNYGKSPAIRLGYRHAHLGAAMHLTEADDGPWPFDEVTGNFDKSDRVTVFPDSKESIRKIRCPLKPTLSDGQINQLVCLSGVTLLVGIEVEYFDVFKKENRYTTREYFMLTHGAEPELMPGGSRIT